MIEMSFEEYANACREQAKKHPAYQQTLDLYDYTTIEFDKNGETKIYNLGEEIRKCENNN